MSKNTLSDLAVGQSAVLEQVSGDFSKRYAAMGLVKGATVTLVRKAPLGDPMEISVKGYKLSIRKDDAKQILIKMEG